MRKMEPESSSARKKTKTTTMNNEGGGDRISELPDDVLHHILSFLDMTYVVTTSILSSRWRYLCISMPSLNFNQVVFNSNKRLVSSYRFCNFVDMVLQSKTSIEKLSLTCERYCLAKDLNRWIVDAVRLNVSVLELSTIAFLTIRPIMPLKLPLCLFTCKTLTALKLDLYHSQQTLDLSLPDSVCLTGLKTLHLSSFSLVGEESTDSFFSRCPVLEKVIICNCKYVEAYKNSYFPSSIFSCETLVSLELDMSWMSVPIFNSIPDSVNLPSLKSLHLGYLHLFSGESTTSTDIFFSRCPVLETLILHQCMFHLNSEILPCCLFTCKTLVKLDLQGWNPVFNVPDLVSLPCLKTLRLESLRFHEGEITGNFFSSCPMLETMIICKCSFRVPLAHEQPNFLIDAFHNIDSDQDYCKIRVSETKNSLETVCTRLNDVIQSNRKSFSFWKKVHIQNDLGNDINRPVSYGWIEAVYDIPTGDLGNLLCKVSLLKLRASFLEDLSGITDLLNKCANLETLALEIGTNEVVFSSSIDMKECWKAGPQLECLLSHLKSVEMLGTVGCDNELEFVEILLKNAMPLQRLKIVFHPRNSRSMKDNFLKKLLTFPRVSCSSTDLYEFSEYGFLDIVIATALTLASDEQSHVWYLRSDDHIVKT